MKYPIVQFIVWCCRSHISVTLVTDVNFQLINMFIHTCHTNEYHIDTIVHILYIAEVTSSDALVMTCHLCRRSQVIVYI